MIGYKESESAKYQFQREEAERRVAGALRALEGIDENMARRQTETPETRAKRILQNRTKEQLKEVRFKLTGERRAYKADSLAYGAFLFIYRKWREAGRPQDGVTIPFASLEKHLKRKKSQVYPALAALNDFVHIENRGRQHNRYRVRLPETPETEAMLDEAMELISGLTSGL